MPVLSIRNRGREVEGTDYWSSEYAERGLFYLSGNAGWWRLLVPESMEAALPEMRTGRRIDIEPSAHAPGCWDIVFDDGTDSPFSIALDKRQIDRSIRPECNVRLAVYTKAGKVFEWGPTAP